MDEAIVSSDSSMADVSDLVARHKTLQTDFIKNENRVKAAREAAASAKQKAFTATSVLYQLNNDFKNVSSSLEQKTKVIGSAKDQAVDLQRRANQLATSATNKLRSINGIE